MTRVVNLHPDALLDRDARGELTAAEEARLESHLERCDACRFERQLRGDFAEELASDVTPSERIALAGLGHAAPKPEIEQAGQPIGALRRRSSPRRVTRATWLLGAAAVFAVSVAGATGAGQRAWSRLVDPSAPNAVTAVQGAPAHVAPFHGVRHRAEPSPTAVSERERREEPVSDVLAPPPAAVAAPRSPAAVRLAAPPVDGVLDADRAAQSANAPSSLFEEATDARRRGSYARAIDLQRELLSRFPRSREAHVVRATMGRLLLDRGDPAGAYASFDAYLAEGSGELGEEAMVGRAMALERLGRAAQATDAWRALLAAYPETPYAAHAKSRLGSVSVR